MLLRLQFLLLLLLPDSQLRNGCEGLPVVAAGAEAAEALVVFGGAVAGVGGPAVAGVAAGEALHEMVADGLGNDAGRCDRVAVGVAVHQGLVLVPNLPERKAVDNHAVRCEAGEGALQRTAHGHGGGDPDIVAVDLAD